MPVGKNSRPTAPPWAANERLAGGGFISDHHMATSSAGGVERGRAPADAELSRMLDLGLAAWRRDRGACDLASVGAPNEGRGRQPGH
jgi:hypothetical protein